MEFNLKTNHHMKQGQEKIQFFKDPQDETEHYIFQKNTKTKIGAGVIIGFLLIIVVAILLSGLTFN
jgi:hypothetical protein